MSGADDSCCRIVKRPLPARDFHTTVLHTLGIDHERLTYRFRGLDTKLTAVKPRRVLWEVLG